MDNHIDFDSTPAIPRDWKLASESGQPASRVKGEIDIRQTDVFLYCGGLNHPYRRWDETMKVREIIEEIERENIPVFTTHLLWWYMDHEDRIPDLKPAKGSLAQDRVIWFFGTVYVGCDGFEYVLGLTWDWYLGKHRVIRLALDQYFHEGVAGSVTVYRPGLSKP